MSSRVDFVQDDFDFRARHSEKHLSMACTAHSVHALSIITLWPNNIASRAHITAPDAEVQSHSAALQAAVLVSRQHAVAWLDTSSMLQSAGLVCKKCCPACVPQALTGVVSATLQIRILRSNHLLSYSGSCMGTHDIMSISSCSAVSAVFSCCARCACAVLCMYNHQICPHHVCTISQDVPAPQALSQNAVRCSGILRCSSCPEPVSSSPRRGDCQLCSAGRSR